MNLIGRELTYAIVAVAVANAGCATLLLGEDEQGETTMATVYQPFFDSMEEHPILIPVEAPLVVGIFAVDLGLGLAYSTLWVVAKLQSGDQPPSTPQPPPPPQTATRPPPTPPPSSSSPPARAEMSGGTCFSVDREGHILTAYHIVAQRSNIEVKFRDRAWEPARVTRASKTTDLALLKVDRSTTKFLALSRDSSVHLGQKVFTVGYPVVDILGTDAKFAEGSISSLSGPGQDASWLQTSISAQPGNSGGPIISEQGDVVGVLVAKPNAEVFFKHTGSLPEDISWAVKSEIARSLLGSVIARDPATDRDAAILRAQNAVCRLKAR